MRLVVVPFACFFFFLILAGATVWRYALEAFFETQLIFAGRGVSHGGSRCDAGSVFQEASRQTRFLV